MNLLSKTLRFINNHEKDVLCTTIIIVYCSVCAALSCALLFLAYYLLSNLP
jgi:hypothetical protein